MTPTLFIILLALGLLARGPSPWLSELQQRLDALLQSWLLRLQAFSGALRLTLALGVPALIGLFILQLLAQLPLHGWLQALFALLLLLYALSPGQEQPPTGAEMADTAALSAFETLARASETAAYTALKRRFGPLFWFVLLGPIGALLYRLIQQIAQQPLEPPQGRAEAQHIARLADWLPARLLVVTLALVGDWERTLDAWRQWQQTVGASEGYLAEPSFLAAAASAESASGDAPLEPVLVQQRLQRLFRRALIGWLLILALLAIGTWIR